MKKLIVALCLGLTFAIAWALPTVEQVESVVGQGNYAQAEGMMREVIQAHPQSAKAHYVYAEILAHNGHFSKASEEVRRAEQLDPSIAFTDAEKFRAFERLLQREEGRGHLSKTSVSPSFGADGNTSDDRAQSWSIPNWVWLVAFVCAGIFLWRSLPRGQSSSAPARDGESAPSTPVTGYAAAPPAAPPATYGAPPVPVAPSGVPSSGALKTGLAVAGGVAAGMLVDEMINHRQGGVAGPVVEAPTQAVPIASDDAANQLEQRSIDFGDGDSWDAAPDQAASNSNSDSDDGGWG